MITKEQALTLTYRTEVHMTGEFDSKGRCRVARVNGMVKTWKRSPDCFYVPMKYGMGYRSQSGYHIDETNAQHWHLASECPQLHES